VKPDYRRIHELEYRLGFRDDPPPGRPASAQNLSRILKEVWTDEPGAIIEYDPRDGVPKY